MLLLNSWHEAFNYSERARSRVFLDVLRQQGCNCPGSRSGLLEEEKALNEQNCRAQGEARG